MKIDTVSPLCRHWLGVVGAAALIGMSGPAALAQDGVAVLRIDATSSHDDKLEATLGRCIATAFPSPPALGRDAPAAALRDALFPWFDPGVAPTTAAEVGALLEQRLVRERLNILGIRYLILFSGGTFSTSQTSDVGVLPYAGIWGSWSNRMSFRLAAAIWDVKYQAAVGIGQLAWSQGQDGVWLGLFPVFRSSSTESQACEQIVELVRGAIRSEIEPGMAEKVKEIAPTQIAPAATAAHKWCNIEGAGPDSRVWLTAEACELATEAETKGFGTEPWCLADPQGNRPLCYYATYEACIAAKITQLYRCVSRE
jgi:hypothetical protein